MVSNARGRSTSWLLLLTSLLRDKLRKTDATIVQTASVANLLMSAFDPGDPNTFQKFTAEQPTATRSWGYPAHQLLAQPRHDLRGLPPRCPSHQFCAHSHSRTRKFYSSALSKSFGRAEEGGDNLAYFLTGTPGIHFESGEYYNSKRKLGLRRPMAKKFTVARRIFDDLGEQLC